ncbi:MAG: M23 family metallopeptidase [Ardenticatenaceae bacterium]|nr:M23 family metallopeptidase [Ardenticatenaceae bacterium]
MFWPQKNRSYPGLQTAFWALAAILTSCTVVQPPSEEIGPLTPTPLAVAQASPTFTLTATPAPTSTPTPFPTAPPTPVPTATPVPCQAPQLEDAGRWCFSAAEGALFIHPLAIEVWQDNLYLLDAGRIVRVSPQGGPLPTILLRPGELIDGMPVLEPLDLSVSVAGLHVLDRAGNVYRLDWTLGEWVMERNERPIGETSSHYYTALDSSGLDRYLLETSYSYGLRYDDPAALPINGWPLDEAYFIDIAALRLDGRSEAHVLQQQRDSRVVEIIFYEQGEVNRRFNPRVEIERPRALHRSEDRLFLLDQGGLRVTALEASTGLLIEEESFTLSFPVTALTTTADGQLILAGRDAVYFPGRSEMNHVVPQDDLLLTGRWPHDPQTLTVLPPMLSPIENLAVSDRDLRMPGAPRHYRLGIHEGADFYWGPGREVRATADGIIVRATLSYIAPGEEQFAAWRALAANQGYSDPDMLDFFRGRQVWIDHGQGIITRYVHLGGIDPAIREGQPVTAGQIIGFVGNSGSPGSLISDSEDAHLHYEIRVDEFYIGQFLRPIEIREIFEGIFR